MDFRIGNSNVREVCGNRLGVNGFKLVNLNFRKFFRSVNLDEYLEQTNRPSSGSQGSRIV